MESLTAEIHSDNIENLLTQPRIGSCLQLLDIKERFKKFDISFQLGLAHYYNKTFWIGRYAQQTGEKQKHAYEILRQGDPPFPVFSAWLARGNREFFSADEIQYISEIDMYINKLNFDIINGRLTPELAAAYDTAISTYLRGEYKPSFHLTIAPREMILK
jgi:hypothetical protein